MIFKILLSNAIDAAQDKTCAVFHSYYSLPGVNPYQRNVSVRHVQKAAAHFALYQINPVKVSRRDGVNYVFNGHHTIESIALVSNSRETPGWCMIYD